MLEALRCADTAVEKAWGARLSGCDLWLMATENGTN